MVADDNPVVRAGLTALLSGRADIKVVAEAADGREAYEAAHQHRPDVVLLDVRMPGVDGISALPYLVRIAPVVMLTYSRESEIVQEALRRGAGGYLVHGEFTADQLVEAVRDIKEGRAHFTPTAAGALLAQLRQNQAPTPPLPEGLGRSSNATAYGISPPQTRILNLNQRHHHRISTHLTSHPHSFLQKTFRKCNRMWDSHRLDGRRVAVRPLRTGRGSN